MNDTEDETVDEFFERCKQQFRDIDEKERQDLDDILIYNHPV